MPTEQALHIAAQCWRESETSSKVMDVELATVFAKKLDEVFESKESAIKEIQRLRKSLIEIANSNPNGNWARESAREVLGYDDDH